MPPAAGWCCGTLRGLTLLGSVIESDVTHDGTAGSSGGAFLAGIDGYMGPSGLVLQSYWGSGTRVRAERYFTGIVTLRPMPSGRGTAAWASATAAMRARMSDGNGATFRAVMSM